MLRLVLLGLIACTLLLAACGGDDNTTESAATPTATADSGPAPLDGSKTYVATVSTSMGDFEITLDPKQAPKTGGSWRPRRSPWTVRTGSCPASTSSR